MGDSNLDGRADSARGRSTPALTTDATDQTAHGRAQPWRWPNASREKDVGPHTKRKILSLPKSADEAESEKRAPARGGGGAFGSLILARGCLSNICVDRSIITYMQCIVRKSMPLPAALVGDDKRH